MASYNANNNLLVEVLDWLEVHTSLLMLYTDRPHASPKVSEFLHAY